MKKNTLLLILALISSFTWYSCQQDDVSDPVEEIPTEDKDPWAAANNSLFWRVSGNGLEQPAHMFGTIHIISENDFSFEQGLDSLLELSTSLMLEMDISDPKIIAAAQSRMVSKQGESAEELFSAEELEKVKALAAALGTPWRSIKHLTLMTLESHFGSTILKQDLGVSSGYEAYLVDEAQKAGTLVKGAEDADYVYTYQDAIPNEQLVQRLVETSDQYLKNKEEYLEGFTDLVQIYLAQDLSALHRMSFKEDTDPTYQALIIGRNLAWMEAINDGLDGKLIAVGAGHLGGSHGLVHLLREQGYTVSPIKIAR